MMSRIIVIGLVIAVVLGSVAGVVLYEAHKARTELPVLGQVGEFSFTDQYGDTFTNKDMLGKYSVVDFFFTSCHGPCPTMNAHIADLYRAFAGTDKVQFVSFSVDPEVDSVATLAEYADRFGVDDHRWVFLTGPKDSIAHVCRDYFMLPADDLPGNHSTRFALVDPKGQIRAYYGGTDPAAVMVLKNHLRELLEGKL